MFAVYLLQPVSFAAAVTASSAVACLYAATISWRWRMAGRGAEGSEPLLSAGAAEARRVARRSKFWYEFLPAFVT